MPHFHGKNPINSAPTRFHTRVYSMHKYFHTKAKVGAHLPRLT